MTPGGICGMHHDGWLSGGVGSGWQGSAVAGACYGKGGESSGVLKWLI